MPVVNLTSTYLLGHVKLLLNRLISMRDYINSVVKENILLVDLVPYIHYLCSHQDAKKTREIVQIRRKSNGAEPLTVVTHDAASPPVESRSVGSGLYSELV